MPSVSASWKSLISKVFSRDSIFVGTGLVGPTYHPPFHMCAPESTCCNEAMIVFRSTSPRTAPFFVPDEVLANHTLETGRLVPPFTPFSLSRHLPPDQCNSVSQELNRLYDSGMQIPHLAYVLRPPADERSSKLSARTSLLTRFRPHTWLTLETHVQYKRNPARCQFTTVLGVTKMSGLVHPDQNVRNATQNSLCRAVNRRRG
jgi:hypothetical protein